MSYESEVLRSWYLLFHYGTREEILDGVALPTEMMPDDWFRFPVATVESFQRRESNGRALDIGCAVGRSTLEMTAFADEVIGIDFSQSFVDVAEEIRKGDKVEYFRYGERHLHDTLVADCPANLQPEKVSFEQGDAMDLREDLGSFDIVHAANLLCRLPEPDRFLQRLPELVNPGGELVLATPATWMDDYTPVAKQPAGQTLDFVKQNLEADFDLIEVREIPFFIREHQRKMQLSTSQASLWRRKV